MKVFSWLGFVLRLVVGSASVAAPPNCNLLCGYDPICLRECWDGLDDFNETRSLSQSADRLSGIEKYSTFFCRMESLGSNAIDFYVDLDSRRINSNGKEESFTIQHISNELLLVLPSSGSHACSTCPEMIVPDEVLIDIYTVAGTYQVILSG